ncbi:hypothetical protein C8F01DRAFT_1119748 [Mycena amicta]|nr:hypothetical protein C8F01DRAFT_1119748 [Mycena amicta]
MSRPSVEGHMASEIQDLVQRNRTLEHLNKKSADENALSSENHKRAIHDLTEHHKRAVHDLKAQSAQFERTYREGVNRLVSAHQLSHLRLAAKLSEADAAVSKQAELTRQQKLACLHRDFQLTMFRARESDLEVRIEELEDQLHHGKLEGNDHISEINDRLRVQQEEIEALKEEMSAAETELSALRESHTRLEVASNTATTKLERVTLQLEGARTTHKDLERQNDELKRTNDQIKRQLDRWQNLESKGGEEAEALRKQRVDLEVQVKALQGRLEKKEVELKKERDKVVKFKANVDEFEAYGEEQLKAAENNARQLAKAQDQIRRLQQELDEARASVPRPGSPTLSEAEVALDMANAPPSSPVRPPPRKITSKAKGGASNGRRSVEPVAGPSNLPDSDIEEVPPPKRRATSKTPANPSGSKRPKPRSRTAAKDDGDETEEEPQPTKSKGKGKAIQSIPSEKRVGSGKRGRDEGEGSETTGGKPRARTGQVQPRGSKVLSDDEDEFKEPAAKKKKRTIGIFPTSSQPSFNFLTATADTIGGIDIPTVLSPVRAGDPVPSRSASARAASSSLIGGLLGGWRK